jgi:hypothetical protein
MILIIIFVLSSCETLKGWNTSYMGTVIKINENEVCVDYESNVNEKRVYNCYDHCDGHSYVVGDSYPDFDKHTKIK